MDEAVGFTTFDVISHAILAFGFFVAAVALLWAAISGPKVVQWLRGLGAFTSASYALWYLGLTIASAGGPIEPYQLAIMSRFIHTLVLALMLIWALGRPDMHLPWRNKDE